MHDDLAWPGGGGALLRGGAREKGDPIHQVHQAIVVPGDETLGKESQRIFRLAQNASRALKRVPIKTFTVDAEYSDPREDEGL